MDQYNKNMDGETTSESSGANKSSFTIDRKIDFDKLRRLASAKDDERVNSLRSMQTPDLPPLEKQEIQMEDGTLLEKFGSIDRVEAAKLAAISKATGAEIYITGSSAADVNKLLEARARYGDTIKQPSGEEVARPVSDIDFLINPQGQSKEQYDVACAMLQKHIIDSRKKGSELKADYMILSPDRNVDPNKPSLAVSGGKVTSYSPGSESYYTPRGGGVKIVDRSFASSGTGN